MTQTGSETGGADQWITLRSGQRLRSVACDTEVIVTRAAGDAVRLSCGGSPMVEVGAEAATATLEDTGSPTLLGKRYVDAEQTLELLCTKGGAGTLAIDGVPLDVKGAKPLPSSD